MNPDEAWNELFKEAIRRRLPMEPMFDQHRISYVVKLANGERLADVQVLLNTRGCFYFHVCWSQQSVADLMRKKFAPRLIPIEYKLKRTGVRYGRLHARRAIERSLDHYLEIIEILEGDLL